MMHKGGVRSEKGSMPDALRKQTTALLDAFGEAVDGIVKTHGIRRGVVRSLMPCTLIALLDDRSLFILAERHPGMCDTWFLHEPGKTFTMQHALQAAVLDIGLDSPFGIRFPIACLSDTPNRQEVIQAIANSHVESERQRSHRMLNTVQVSPIFGAPEFTLNDKLVFVLMPFRDDLTKIYESIVKPTIEATGLVCRRADDYKTNKAVMQDIWKAICEARIVLADMTGLNPNVMYELGVAHTVGKETILINQTAPEPSPDFPFDLAHIRRIEYKNDATGGKQLGDDLSATVKCILEPVLLTT